MPVGSSSNLKDVKALLFDVFGTVVDWRTSVTEELYLRAFRKLSSPDLSEDLKAKLESLGEEGWGRFADEWRASYGTFTAKFDPANDPWRTVDQHHRDSLAQILDAWGLAGLYSSDELDSLSLVWHRLAPWPDSPDALAALGERLSIAMLSNGNKTLLQDLDDFGGLGFHHLFSAEDFSAYKPNAATYLGAVRELGGGGGGSSLEPHQVALVAAHLGDLQAARICGLRTIYIERPREEEWGADERRFHEAREWVDLWVTGEEEGLLSVAKWFSSST